MSQIQVSTGPGGLMALTGAARPEQIEAYFYTFTKAQILARATSADPSSDSYFQAMTDALGPLGWTQIRATPYRHAPSGNPGSPLTAMVDAFLQILASALPFLPIDVTRVNGWLASAERTLADPPPEIAQQLDAWWNGTRAGSARVMTVGPLTDILGTAWLGAAHVSLTLSGDDWRAMIRPSSEFGFTAAPVVMSLNAVAYALVADKLKAELHDQVAARIADATLDLDHKTMEATL